MRALFFGLALALCTSAPATAQPAAGQVMYGFLANGTSSIALNKGRTAIQQGRYDEAKAVLDRLAGDGSTNPDVFYLAGLANLGAGSPRRAQQLFAEALSNPFVLSPLPVEFVARAEHGLAMSHIQLGERDRAEKVLQSLKAKQAECSASCEGAVALDTAVSSLSRLLG